MPSSHLSDYPAVRDYLYGLKHRGSKYGIDRMRLLSEKLGYPERSFPVVHIGGTNGKGSVAAMVESVFRNAGYHTGLFTSPHLVRQGERIQVDRTILHEDQIVAYTRELRGVAEDLAAKDPDDHPSFFEFMTGMAFLHFARSKVDVAIIEVGLGGRLDSTNVVDPDVSVITTIGLDHCEILGDTLAKIAAEKAGIIKPGKPVVIGLLPPEAETVIRARADELGSEVHAVANIFGTDRDRFPETSLIGDHQRENAATATLACRLMRKRIELPENVIATGLKTVEWAGRWQSVVIGGRTVIFEASHNQEGARALEGNLRQLIADTGRKPVVVVGVLGEPRARGVLATLARHAREIHLVVPAQPRASTHERLRACLPADCACGVFDASVDELFPAKGVCDLGEPGDTVVVTGSIYLIGEVMERALYDAPFNQGALQD